MTYAEGIAVTSGVESGGVSSDGVGVSKPVSADSVDEVVEPALSAVLVATTVAVEVGVREAVADGEFVGVIEGCGDENNVDEGDGVIEAVAVLTTVDVLVEVFVVEMRGVAEAGRRSTNITAEVEVAVGGTEVRV